MAKNLASKLRTGAMAGLTALAVMAPMKGNASLVLDNVSTTIYNSQDMDPNRAGVQVMYEWGIRNKDPPASDYTQDALWKVTIGADLAHRGMYGFNNNNYDNNFEFPSFTKWSSDSDNGNYSWLANLPGNEPIRGNDDHYFRALIDADQIIGNEQVGIQGFANSGATQIAQVTVPQTIPEPTTIGALLTGAVALLAGRRLKENYRR